MSAGSSHPPAPEGKTLPGAADLVGFLLLLLLLLTGFAESAAAQDLAEPVLEGRVEQDGRPVEDGTVVLHRVSPEAAGPIDSTAVGEDGRFHFELPSVPGFDPRNQVYFASVRYQGVVYFGAAIADAVQLDSLYLIEVHDTLAAPPGGREFEIIARNLLLEQVEGEWVAVDLFRIRNETDRTVVGLGEEGVVWTHPLPPEAFDFEAGESDLAPDAVEFRDGMIRVSSPVPPGERMYIMRYRVADLPFTIPVAAPTERLEILVREPADPLSMSGVSRLAPVAIEPGSNYRRFAADDLSNFVVEVTAGEESESGTAAWVAVILALVLAGVAIYALKRDGHPAGASTGPSGKEALLLQIAELDDAFGGGEGLPRKQRRRYQAERGQLLERLREMG